MNFSKIIEIATLAAPIILFIGVVIGCYFYKRLKKEYRFLVWYLIICLISDQTSRLAGELYKNNLIFIVLFSLCEVLFFTIYYQSCLFKKRVPLYLIMGIASSIYIIWEIISLWGTHPSEFQTYSRVISSFLIIMMAISSLFEKIEQKQKNNKVIKLNFIFLIYFSLHLVFFLPINFLINVASSVKYYFWCANLLLTISFYIIISLEIWKNGSMQKQLRSGF